MQRCMVAVGIFVLMLAAITTVEAQNDPAQTEYPGGYTIMPLEPGPVALLSMTVDANIRDDGEQAIAEVQVVFRVHNRDKTQKQTLTVAIPGYPAPKPPPSQLSFTVDGKDIPMSAGRTQWWVADIVLKPNQRRNLVLTYTAPLGDGPFVRWTYPIDLTARLWPGKMQSARVTLGFNEPPNPQSWLKLTPEDYKLTAESITWSFDAKDPTEPIDFILMRPSLWSRLRAARQASVAADAPASAYMQLGDMYTELATISGDPALFERYFPLAVAAYSQAQATDPKDTASYLALSRLYRMRSQLSQPPDSKYISLAVNQLAGALEQGTQDPDIAAAVAKDFAEMIARARLQADFDTANSYIKQLDELEKKSQIPIENETLAEERRQLAIDWATNVLRDQGPGPAREVFEQSFGPESAVPPSARFARLNSLHIDTNTELGNRIITIEAAPRVGGAELIQELIDALQSAGVAEVTLIDEQPSIIAIELSFEDAEELLNKQRALAAAIPIEPEWTLLSTVLLPQSLTWDRVEERWFTTDTYSESVSLIAAVADIGIEALALDQAANTLDQADPLNALRAEMWRAEANVWRRLAENNRARFTLIMDPSPGPPIAQTWSLEPGEQVHMTGSARQYHIFPVILAIVGVYLAIVFVSFLFWWRDSAEQEEEQEQETVVTPENEG